MKFKAAGIVVVFAAAAVASSIAAHAAEPVILAGQIAFRLADPGPFPTVSDRVRAVDARICDAISYENVGEPHMKVALHNGRWSVYIGNTYLVSVYPLDVKHYSGLSPKRIAALWASRLKRLFPLSEPLTKMSARKAGRILHDVRRPTTACQPRKISVPPEHWGLIDRFLVILWQARIAPDDQMPAALSKLSAQVIEAASRHYFASPCKPQGHEPGTCPSIRTCKGCQADIQAALEVPAELHDKATALAVSFAHDEDATRAVRQAFEYVRRIDGQRFHAERVRIAWALWKRLYARAKDVLVPRLTASSSAEQISRAAGECKSGCSSEQSANCPRGN